MSIYSKFIWPIVDLSAVCDLQNVSSAGPLMLNGTLFNSSIPNQISFIGVNIIRSVSLTSANNLSGRTFIINGFQNNAPVTDTIPGPNGNTVYGSKFFDIITSITVDAAVNGIQVGTGKAGYLPLLSTNTQISIINYSVSILLPSGSGITYSLFNTLDQINYNFISFLDQESNLFPAFGLTNQTTSQIGSSQDITNFILLKVNNSTLPLTDTFDFVFLQA